MGQQTQRRGRPVAQSRLVAYDVLRDVAERDAYANLALQARISKQQLTGRDAAFATELVSQTLRLQGKYDALIALAAGRETAAIDARTLRVLRLGAHQVLAMRVPQHAALHETVELQKLVANPKAAGFVNAVLRKLSSQPLAAWEAQLRQQLAGDAALAALHSHPEWVLRALRDALGWTAAAAALPELLAADNAPPPVQLALLPAPGCSAAELRRRALAALPEHLTDTGASPCGVALRGMQPAEALTALAQAGIVARVQDQGSQLVALALVAAKPVMRGEKWLDLCAGPGGKTAFLAASAAAAEAGVTLRANEVAAHRAQLVAQALESAGPQAQQLATVVNCDGTADAAYGAQLYDRILVDAPCSGLGALRRRPEARWRKTPGDIPQLVRLQEQLLARALAGLAPGGVLGYVTCSPHLAETRAIVQRTLRNNPGLRLLDTRAIVEQLVAQARGLQGAEAAGAEPGGAHSGGAEPAGAEFGPGQSVAQLWPHRDDTDAMFIALFTTAAG